MYPRKAVVKKATINRATPVRLSIRLQRKVRLPQNRFLLYFIFGVFTTIFPTYFSSKITYILHNDLHKHIPHRDWPS